MVIFNKDQKRSFLEGVSVAPDHLLALWTAQILDQPDDTKVPGLTRAVLMDFSLRQMLGIPQSPVTLNWLSEAFDRLLRHEAANKVFPLPKRARHRPIDDSTSIQVAWWVHLAHTTRGYSLVKAKELAAEKFAKDAKSIDRYVKAQAHWVSGKNQVADWEDFFIAERKPLPAPKDKKSRVPVPTKRR